MRVPQIGDPSGHHSKACCRSGRHRRARAGPDRGRRVRRTRRILGVAENCASSTCSGSADLRVRDGPRPTRMRGDPREGVAAQADRTASFLKDELDACATRRLTSTLVDAAGPEDVGQDLQSLAGMVADHQRAGQARRARSAEPGRPPVAGQLASQARPRRVARLGTPFKDVAFSSAAAQAGRASAQALPSPPSRSRSRSTVCGVSRYPSLVRFG